MQHYNTLISIIIYNKQLLSVLMQLCCYVNSQLLTYILGKIQRLTLLCPVLNLYQICKALRKIGCIDVKIQCTGTVVKK